VEIQLWPEYDRVATLVIIDGALPAGTALPAELGLPMPASAGPPHAVALRNPAGALLDAPYTTAPAGDELLVRFTTTELAFRIEYYDPALTLADDTRTLVFEWTSAYAVGLSEVRVQQPFGASGLTGDPALIALGVAEDSLSYYARNYGSLPANGQISLTVTYTKPTSQLTVEALGGAQPATQPASAPATSSNLPWIVGGGAVGLGLLALGGWLWRRGQHPASRATGRGRSGRGARERGHPAVVRRRHAAQSRRAAAAPVTPNARPAPRPAAKGPEAEAPVAVAAPKAQAYCTRCGHRLAAGDRFCRDCGAPVAGL
jgi:hypothetical protein